MTICKRFTMLSFAVALAFAAANAVGANAAGANGQGSFARGSHSVRSAPPTRPDTSAIPATLNISPDRPGAPLPETALGMNMAVWDGDAISPATVTRLKALHVRVLRWPGGSYADQFHWSQYKFSFDQFVAEAKQVGAQPLLTVNYGSGTPAEAAAWVRYANVTHHDGIRYWEIGNEIYGDGEYGPNWETNVHSHKGPATYGRYFLQYVKAMKAVDPHILIGAVCTIPGVWPSGQAPDWDATLLPIIAKYVDFLVIHWYPQNPGQENDAQLLSAPQSVPSYMQQLQSEIGQYAGSRAKHIQVFLDEMNSVSSNPGKQADSLVNALFLDEGYAAWLQSGVANVSWWDLHNNPITNANNDPSLYGNATFGDYGVLSTGQSPEPPLNTALPPYWGYKMFSLFAEPGDRFLPASANQFSLSVAAVRRPDGGVNVLIVNTDPTSTYRVRLSGIANPAGQAFVWYNYGEGRALGGTAAHIVKTTGVWRTAGISVKPYSETVLVLGRH